MQANPDKFQAIAVGKKTYAKEPVFNIESANISCDEVVKLDYKLNFAEFLRADRAIFRVGVFRSLAFHCKILNMP
jgi:hypothetical protein